MTNLPRRKHLFGATASAAALGVVGVASAATFLIVFLNIVMLRHLFL